MKKKVLLMFLGMPRCFEFTADNIYDKLINCNKKYEFTLIFNIQNDLRLGKFKDLSVNSEIKSNQIKIINIIKKTYKCCIKDIVFYDIPKDKLGVGHDNNVRRIVQILDLESVEYDFYINLRMDIALSNKIYLDNYLNSFVIINSSKYRYCSFHNNDWDYMWIGYRESYKYWISAYLSLYPLFSKLDVKEMIYSCLDGFKFCEESFDDKCLYRFKQWKLQNNTIDCKFVANQTGIVDTFYLRNNSWIERPLFVKIFIRFKF